MFPSVSPSKRIRPRRYPIEHPPPLPSFHRFQPQRSFPLGTVVPLDPHPPLRPPCVVSPVYVDAMDTPVSNDRSFGRNHNAFDSWGNNSVDNEPRGGVSRGKDREGCEAHVGLERDPLDLSYNCSTFGKVPPPGLFFLRSRLDCFAKALQ